MKNENINLYDILSNSNIAAFQKSDTEVINKYIADYGAKKGINTPRNTNMRAILKEWSDNKQFLFHLLGNKFIYEFPISISLNEEEKIAAMEKALKNKQGYKLKEEFNNYFNKKNNYFNFYQAILQAYEPQNLIKNKWFFGNFTINLGTKPLIITNSMKITTAFKKISQYFKLNYYEEFRLAQSLGTNLKENQETAYLSIHPLDFFTIADNKNHWHTCLSWQKYGVYCLDTIKLMNSSTALVAYIKSSTPMSLPLGKWNSKKWRETFFISSDFILEDKAFPYRCDAITIQILQKIKELYQNLYHCNIISSNYDDLQLNKKIILINDYHFISPLKISADANHKNSRSHFMLYKDNFIEQLQDEVQINISGKAICLWCGHSIDIEHSINGQVSNIFCADCSQVHSKCECCGKLIFSNNLMDADINNQIYCPDCMLTKCINDDIDYQLYPKEENMRIYFAAEFNHPVAQDNYINILSINSAYSKKRTYNLGSYFKNIHRNIMKLEDGHYEIIYFVNRDDLKTAEFCHLFGDIDNIKKICYN